MQKPATKLELLVGCLILASVAGYFLFKSPKEKAPVQEVPAPLQASCSLVDRGIALAAFTSSALPTSVAIANHYEARYRSGEHIVTPVQPEFLFRHHFVPLSKADVSRLFKLSELALVREIPLTVGKGVRCQFTAQVHSRIADSDPSAEVLVVEVARNSTGDLVATSVPTELSLTAQAQVSTLTLANSLYRALRDPSTTSGPSISESRRVRRVQELQAYYGL